jgi:biotin synthase-like enzyme
MKLTPKQQVTKEFESKEQLVAKLIPLLEDKDTDAKDLKKKLLHVSNKKLLRLQEVASKIKTQFNSKSKLVEAILSMKFGSKKIDSTYQEKIQTYSIKKLYDVLTQAKKQHALNA